MERTQIETVICYIEEHLKECAGRKSVAPIDIGAGSTIIMFVRQAKEKEKGKKSAFCFRQLI